LWVCKAKTGKRKVSLRFEQSRTDTGFAGQIKRNVKFLYVLPPTKSPLFEPVSPTLYHAVLQSLIPWVSTSYGTDIGIYAPAGKSIPVFQEGIPPVLYLLSNWNALRSKSDQSRDVAKSQVSPDSIRYAVRSELT
jgi:hypothetical protein